ncbi:hypothetical protein BV22DRAFT_899365 [Leucogyrophana mollusca]|uniref:Uncharacterized protein n=1 Tax=Leucogyrophana mollusca TaxID=85980 RepID=A0ACB8B0S6_9AGAM|nr:hypothetical protein BV22DRAFT_899365 [Leucogyrophana mollusca]
MFKEPSQYSPVGGVDDDEAKLLHSGAEGFPATPPSRLKPRFLRFPSWLSHGILACTSLLFFTLWMETGSTYVHEHLPIYSPANTAVESHVVRFNGTLDFPSIYRGHPSPELDAAWARVSHDVRPTRMTLDQMLRAGEVNSPSKVKYPDSYGGGFMVSLESTHQLHCLNMLRKASWLDYYESIEPSFQDTPEVVRMHLGISTSRLTRLLLITMSPPDHCIEMVRQNVMCNADVTMITWDWVKGRTSPYPNFNTRHQCRDFEKILDWATTHAVHIPKSEVTPLEDTVKLPLPFHHGTNHHDHDG